MAKGFWNRNPFRMWWVRAILWVLDTIGEPFGYGGFCARDERFPRSSGRWKIVFERIEECPW